MGDSFKRYNKDTGKWEISSSGNAKGISVTDPRLITEGEIIESLNDVLVKQQERIDTHSGNIAWLAEHGGGGSGGGGGATGDKVTLTNSNIVVEGNTNYLYSSTITNIRLEYLITSSKNNKRLFINVSLDGNTIVNNQEAWSNAPGFIIIPKLNQFSGSNTHSIVITATDTDGFTAESYLLTIVEASINITSSVSSTTATVGIDYFITYTVISKIIGQNASIVVTNITNGVTKTLDLGYITSTTPREVNVNLWDLGNIIAGSSYTIQAQAFTSLSDATIQSEIVTNRAVVEDGVNLVVLVEGITTKAEIDKGTTRTKFSQGGNISFSFTPYLAGISLIYYAIRLEHNGVIRDIGYFDTGNYNDNQYVQRGKQQVFSWAIPTDGDILGDWNLTLRCWSEKGTPINNTLLACQVVVSSQSLIDDQNPNNSKYASWNIRQESFPTISTATSWISNEPMFTVPGSLTPVGATTNLNIYNSNGVLSGFLNENGQSILRLAGEAYAIIDLKPFEANASDLNNWSRQGFSLSVTFKTDIHPFSDRTVFFIGDYNTTEEFSEGIKIELEDITWSYTDGNIKETISCKIQQGIINTIDFVVNKNINKKSVSIFKNGVLNVAREIKNDFTWKTSSKFYLGCDNSYNKYIQNFADTNFYDIKLFRAPLNDKEIVINSLNARAKSNLLSDGTIDFVSYNSSKLRNFFSTADNSAQSTLWNDINQTYANINFNSLISDTTKTLPVDIMLINCANTGYTRAIFEKIGGQDNNWFTGCTMSYFSPTSGKSGAESTTDVAISSQGKSSQGYLIKNVEIRFDKMLKEDNGTNLNYEMFQPKATWFPERQFTLKADVVDSSHANNASIGKFVNDNSDILFEKTPPMEELEARRPVDTRDPSKINTDVTIKQTLEGFPFILLIQFDGESTQTMLGIYSFNLGRGSYHNMGFRFLKDFTTKIKNASGEYVDNKLPAFITSYHNYGQNEKFGKIDQTKVYSYEFLENANTITNGNKLLPLALFMQDDISIIKHVGEFKYNGGNWLEPTAPVTDNNVWSSLQELFSLFAQMTTSTTKKYVWNNIAKGYEEGTGEYPAQSSWSTLAAELNNKLSIRNAHSYFLICTIFGLVDSLGKNFTIVCYSIDGVNKWYVRLYDLDSANGLDNTALESVSETAYLDTFSNNTTTAVNSLVITPNSPDGGYDTYSSRMWDVFRNSIFINTGIFDSSYEKLWDLWRNNTNIIKDHNKYIDNYFYYQTKNCGELLFNYDYNIKYLTAYVGEGSTSSSYANIEFLHGTRIEYVRDWLKRRLWFFDGVFNYNNVSNLQPYNTNGTFSAGGEESSNPKLLVTSNISTIFIINVGNTNITKYFLQKGKSTLITMAPISSFNTQITINNTTQINDLERLKEIRFQRFMSSMKLPSFSNLDMSDVNTFSSGAIPFETIFINDSNFSDVRHINLSNIKFWIGNPEGNTFTVNIEKYTKLKTIDISNSIVTSMSLPNASLSNLNITNSNIENINLINQPFLETIDFTGCRKLKSVTIDSCNKIKEINLSNLGDLHTVNIINCATLETIICTGNINLTTFNVSNSNLVNTIDISKCSNNNLDIYIVGAPNIVSLDMSFTNTGKVVQAANELTKLKTLNISNSNLSAIQYGNKPIYSYKGNQVLDISNLTLDSFDVSNAIGIHYLKVNNDSKKPYLVDYRYFKGCINLKRVFGHISLSGYETFDGCNNFYIHEVPELINGKTPMYNNQWFGADSSTVEGKLEWNNNTNLGTNISIYDLLTDLQYCFRGTACSIYDAYYILYKCNNVKRLYGTFMSCLNIDFTIVNSPNRNMFINCTKAISIASMFYGCKSNADGFIIYTPTRDVNGNITLYNGLFSPLVSCEDMSLLFYYSSPKYTDDYIFAKQVGNKDMKLKHLGNIFQSSLIFIQNASVERTIKPNISEYYPARASKLLNALPDITNITSMFINSNINFELIKDDDVDKTEYCPLFFYNTKLNYISNSFLSLIYSNGSIYNLFGGSIKDKTDRFPKNIDAIYGSFSLANTSNVLYPICNSMFNRITMIRFITTVSAINATSETACFNGFNKIFKQEKDEIFPYDVFTKCTKIVEIPGFFANMSFPDKIEIQLPNNSFINCSSLSNISYLYSNIKNVKYTLTGKGFKNCKLINVAFAFAESNESFTKTGMIPYGLFYQEKLVNESIKGWTSEDSILDSINDNFGIDKDGNWISDSNLQKPLPKERIYIISRLLRNTTISNMHQVLNFFQDTRAKEYTMNYGSMSLLDYGDLIVQNETYDNREYILNINYNPNEFLDDEHLIINPNRDIRRIIINPKKDIYKYVWNIWSIDGLSGLKNMILDSSLYADSLLGKISISPIIPNEFDDEADKISPKGNHANKNIMNYIVPPDFFRYCNNNNSLIITSTFYYCGRANGNPEYNYYDFGLRGRLCPFLFKPVSEATDISYMFYMGILLNPYRWNDTITGEIGQMYSFNQFSYIPKLISISFMFYSTIIPEDVILPVESFIYNSNLQNINSCWRSVQFLSPSNKDMQVPTNIFNRNTNLKDISYSFASGANASDWKARSPKRIESGLFNSTKHKNITNCTGVFYGASNTIGAVPTFWTWLNSLPAANRINTFYFMNKQIITNSNTIPVAWANGMTE